MKRILALIILCMLAVNMFACSEPTATIPDTPAAHTHNFGAWVTMVNATCTEVGRKERACTCGETQSEDIPSISHNFVTVEVTEGTCEVEGTNKQQCSHCKKLNFVSTKPLGHNWSEATCNKPSVCSRCYKEKGAALGHSYGNDNKCTRCGEIKEIDMKTVVGAPKSDIFGFSFYKNSANGIKLSWTADNNSGKTINYITVTLHFYNSVGDEAFSEITKKSTKTIKYVGPVQPGGELTIFNVVDYVPACSKIVIGDIKLEYSDGTVDTGWYGYYTTYQNSRLD